MDNSVKTALVIGLSSDIGGGLAQRLKQDGWRVFGTARAPNKLSHTEAVSFNMFDAVPVWHFKRLLKDQGWDLLIMSIGSLEPVGKFFDVNFDHWAESVWVNFTAQMRVLHALWPVRNVKRIADVMLFAGGGTNGPMPGYSAYCASKIALIKMCELLHDENEDLNIFSIGPGFVKTKIHEQTLKAADGPWKDKIVKFLETEGTSIDDIYDHMQWCMKAGRKVAGGRNFSTVHDDWKSTDPNWFLSSGNPDLYRLRRKEVL